MAVNVGIDTMHVVHCCYLDVTGSWVLAVHTSMAISLGKVSTSPTVFESVVSHHGFSVAGGVEGGCKGCYCCCLRRRSGGLYLV